MNTKVICLLILLFLIFSSSMYSQEKFTLSGTVIVSKINETIIRVDVFLTELKKGTTTN